MVVRRSISDPMRSFMTRSLRCDTWSASGSSSSEFLDWHTPPTSDDDEYYAGNDSGDSNFNGYHPGWRRCAAAYDPFRRRR